jgi:transcriptional regulator with XRE-family HTH domain
MTLVIMSILPEQCRAARALLGWSQQELAARAKVARKTIADFEQGQVTPYPRTLKDIREALEEGGAIFVAAEAGAAGPGVRLKWKAPAGGPPETSGGGA